MPGGLNKGYRRQATHELRLGLAEAAVLCRSHCNPAGKLGVQAFNTVELWWFWERVLFSRSVVSTKRYESLNRRGRKVQHESVLACSRNLRLKDLTVAFLVHGGVWFETVSADRKPFRSILYLEVRKLKIDCNYITTSVKSQGSRLFMFGINILPEKPHRDLLVKVLCILNCTCAIFAWNCISTGRLLSLFPANTFFEGSSSMYKEPVKVNGSTYSFKEGRKEGSSV